MIGHNHEQISRSAGKTFRQTAPHFVDDPPGLAQLNNAVHDLAEQAAPVVRHDGHEMPAWLGVIELFQSYRAAGFLDHWRVIPFSGRGFSPQNAKKPSSGKKLKFSN